MPQLLGSTILAGSLASITITIPSGFNHLHAVWTGRSDSATTAVSADLRLNGDSGSNYLWQTNETHNTSSTPAQSGAATSLMIIGAMPAASATANYFGEGSFTVGGVSGATFKVTSGHSSAYVTTTSSYVGVYSGQWLSTAVVTSVTLLPNAGNLVAGSSMSIYGWG